VIYIHSGPQKLAQFFVRLNVIKHNRFSELFYCQIHEKHTVTKDTQHTSSVLLHYRVKCPVWSKLSQRFAIGQWRRRLECIVQQQGGHIEHLT